MSLMFTSQYSEVAQNNQILNIHALDRAHATTWIINIEALLVAFSGSANCKERNNVLSNMA